MSITTRRRPRALSALIIPALVLVAGAAAAPASAAQATKLRAYEVESTFSIAAGTNAGDAVYNPLNKSTYFLNTANDLVIVVGSDNTVTEISVSAPIAHDVDADGNVWVGGSAADDGRNLTRIAPDLATESFNLASPNIPESWVVGLDANMINAGVVVTSQESMSGTTTLRGQVAHIGADGAMLSYINASSPATDLGIAWAPEHGFMFHTGTELLGGVTETHIRVTPTWTGSGPSYPSKVVTTEGVGKPVHNPKTGRTYVPLSESGVLVFEPSPVNTSAVIAVPVSTDSTLSVLRDGRVAVLSAGSDVPVSFINTDNTVTSGSTSSAMSAAQDAYGTAFIGSADDGLVAIHPNGEASTVDLETRPDALVYNAASNRILAVDASTGAVAVIKAVLWPVAILTPTDGSTVEPGFTVTGEGEPHSRIVVTDGNGMNEAHYVEADGSWSTPTGAHLPAGDYVWTLTQDADGSTAELRFTIAADPVVTPVSVTSPGEGATVGVRPTFTGAGTPGAVVTVSEDGTVLGEATVDADGVWLVKSMVDLAAGAHSVVATQDVDSSTATVSFTVKVVPPGSGGGGTKPGDGQLAATGADSLPFILIGGVLAAAGAAATVLGIRRRRSTD